jgi:hypothetical protein
VAGVGGFGGFAAAPVVGQGDLEHVVDGDHAEQVPFVVDDGDRDQVVVGHQHGHVHHVGVRADPDRVGVRHVDQRRTGRGLEQRDHGHHAAQAAVHVDGVHAGQRLRLEPGRLPDPGQRLGDGGHRGHGDEIHAHQAARAGAVEAKQGQHLGPLPGRQQVDHRLAAPLRQFGDGVGGVVRAHPGHHLGDVGVGAGVEQPGGEVLVQFLEDIGLEFGVGVHPAEDLGFLLLGGALQHVGDLRGLEPADPGEGPAQPGAARMPDQPLEVMPVPACWACRSRILIAAAEQLPSLATDVHAGQHPFRIVAVLSGIDQFQVGGTDQPDVLHVDEPVPEHVGAEQHLALAPLEMPQVKPRAGQLQRIRLEIRHLLGGDEDLPAAADRHHDRGYQRVVGSAQPDDDVGYLAERLTAAIRYRALQQPRQPQRSPPVRQRAGPGGPGR